ncbi:MAG: transposase, partial [Nitrosopumilaceae archaeon]|nr:transposase [Nitrosopumilaceae archaeon]
LLGEFVSIKKYITNVFKKISDGLRVATHEIVAELVEAARTISYVETVSNKADTLHRYIKQNEERDLKKAFEFNTRKAVGRMGLGKTILAVDITHELYYGKKGKMNVRQKRFEKGTGEAFAYVVLSVVKPKPLPLMALPYKQGDDLTSLVKELLGYAKSLPITIQCVLFDRGFYIGDLILYLSSEKIRYLIFVPQNEAMKKYIAQTNSNASFNHTINYNKRKSWWKVQTRIDVIKDSTKDYFWCFATNLRQSLYLISKYKQRWQIETDFRVHDEARIKTKSNEPIVRYFYFLTSLILLANWEVNRLLHPEICFKKYLKFVQEEFEKENG